MSGLCRSGLLALLLCQFVVPAIAAQSCNTHVTATAPFSRYVATGLGETVCWGLNAKGQLGNGTTSDSSTPVTVIGLPTVKMLAAGDSHSCTLRFDGKVQCWGWNGNGQLGNGDDSMQYSPTPVTVNGITNASALAVGYEHSCARLSDGSVWCWGMNSSGQLGNINDVNGKTQDSFTPIPVCGIDYSPSTDCPSADILHAIAIAAGGSHSCAVLADGTVRCWGLNSNGQLGVDPTTTTQSTTAVTVGFPSGSPAAVAIAAGGSHNCSILADGTVWCWGLNHNGQLGNNDQTPQYPTPVLVSGITISNPAVEIAAGDNHSCARLRDGTVWCWGMNADGQLGDGAITDSRIPVEVSGITIGYPAVAIAAGGDHSCAILVDGKVQCWGLNANGELGDGSTDDSSSPVTVGNLGSASVLAAGDRHSCARRSVSSSTLLDTETGLMWKRCSEGQSWDTVSETCAGIPKPFSWQGALQRAQDVNQGIAGNGGENLGYGDWRLPNRNELASLVEHQCNTPAINDTRFPGSVAAPYWSSSPYAGDALRAWYVDFLDGVVRDGLKTDTSISYYVRLVRGGQ